MKVALFYVFRLYAALNRFISCYHGNRKHEVNAMFSQLILASRKMSKHLSGLCPDQFDALYNFLGPIKFLLRYWLPDASDNDNEVVQ